MTITSVDNINIDPFLQLHPSCSKNFKIACKTAIIFEKSFTGYTASVLLFTFSDNSILAFPIIKLATKVSSLLSLPYHWKSSVFSTTPKNKVTQLQLAFQKLPTHYFSMSLPDSKQELSGNKIDVPKIIVSTLESNICSFENTFDVIFNKYFSSKTRNQCRKALKSNLTIRKSNSVIDVQNYFNLYKKTSVKWSKSYSPYPFSFFQQLAESEFTDFWVCYLDDQFLGGVFMIKYDNWIYYWAGMTDRKYSPLCANNGLLYTSMKEYSENGFDYFDFGPSVGLDNVEKFKSGFGTTPHLHHIYEYKSNLYKHILRPLQMLKSRLL